MRILMLTQFYPPTMGGIERYVHGLSTALSERGHQVSVATLQLGGQSEFSMDGDVRVYRVHGTVQRFARFLVAGRQHLPPFPDPEVTFSLRRIIAEEKPDIVHAHNWIVHSFLPLKAGSRAKLVMTLHDYELVCTQMRMMFLDNELCSGPAFARCLRCSLHHYGLAKGVIALSGSWATRGLLRSMVDMFLPVSRAVASISRLTETSSPHRVVPNFVPDDVATPMEQLDTDPRLTELPGEGFILQVGDLSFDKGVGVLLDAYAGLPSAPPLVLIGRRLAESLRELPPNVTVIDGLPHASVMRAWRQSLFGTVPSIFPDPCPTVVMEAMASGRPVIGSSIGGIVDEILDGETGLLVPSGDVAALRHAMAKLIADPELRQKMGENARHKVEDFKASTVVSQVEAVYESLWLRAT